MKACWNRILLLSVALLPTLLLSCEKDTVDIVTDEMHDKAFNQFSVGGYDYSVEMETSRGEMLRFESEENGYYCSLTATPRGTATRASFDDIVWDTHDSKVGIFVVEHVDDPAAATSVNVIAESANLSRLGNTITSSSVNILEKIRYYDPASSFYNKSVDVCAYFPYAEEIKQAVALSNTSNSIVGIFNAANENNVLHLPFTMKPTQTDNNIWFHDLMVSVRESSNELNAFGNIAKRNRSTYSGSSITGYVDLSDNVRTDRGSMITCDNVHLRMQHLFSRFNIRIKYDSRFEGAKINRVYVDGSKVYSYGQINLLTGVVTEGGASKIDRLISDDIINEDIETTMILCPCQLTAEGEMVFHIFIDGVEYTCDLYKLMKDVEVKASYVYNLTFSFSKASTIIVNNGYGGTAATVQYSPGDFDTYNTYGERLTIPSGTSDTPYTKIGEMAQWLVVAPKLGWDFKGIYVNGELIQFNPGTVTPLVHAKDGYRIREFLSADGSYNNHYYCKLEEVSGKNTRYDIVYMPAGTQWYVKPEHIIQQFDGIYNNGFTSVIRTDPNGVEYEAIPPTDPGVTIWKDLSGKGNDAQLANIDIHADLMPWRHQLYDQTQRSGTSTYLQYTTTQQSGWVEGGLKIDGVNDYVTFPAVLPPRDNDPDTQDLNLTIEMYVGMECPQPGRFPRILCEAEPGTMQNDVDLTTFTTHGFPSLLFTSLSDTASSTNVIYYKPTSGTSIYFMGCGHNNGYSNDGKLAFGPDGKRIMHLVFWYRGGYGELTDMSIFKDTHQFNRVSQLGLGDPRNGLITMVEYWDPDRNRIVRHTLSFYGNDPANNAFGVSKFNGLKGSVEYKKFLEAVFNNGVETTPEEFETLKAESIEFDRLLIRPLQNTISAQNHDAYLEDPFAPSERWASIGGRQNDYSRQFNGIIYSYIMYDTLLTIEEVDTNRTLHFNRFGAYKTDVREGGGINAQ